MDHVRLRLILAYEGTDFDGWQAQGKPGLRTVQEELEKALATLCGGFVRVHGSGRTDAGVHAQAQTAHADVPANRAHLPWQKALNAVLPRDLRVAAARLDEPDFHARFSAVGKTYAYVLWHDRAFVPPLLRRQAWACGPLDLDALDRAATVLTGCHDFAAFMNQGTPVRSTVRAVTGIERATSACGRQTTLTFTAGGFLKQMVRNLVATLVEAGRGKVSGEDVRSVLMSRDRSLAAATAPAQGLSLDQVYYPESPAWLPHLHLQADKELHERRLADLLRLGRRKADDPGGLDSQD